MSKKKLKERVLHEGMLDKIFKGVLAMHFGSKLLTTAAKHAALQDKKVKNSMAELKDAIAEFDAQMAKYKNI